LIRKEYLGDCLGGKSRVLLLLLLLWAYGNRSFFPKEEKRERYLFIFLGDEEGDICWA